MARRRPPLLGFVLCVIAGGAILGAAPPADREAQRWVEEMKTSPKGPFEAIRWFCEDGSVLLPRPYACVEHGGGIQHGLLGARAKQLRERGFLVANVIASLDRTRFVGAAADLESLRQLVLERFLIGWNDGWIFRRARTYRGALQSEDEEAAAERLLLELLADEGWLAAPRYLLLRELGRWLPLQGQQDLAARVRSLTAQLADADEAFAPLRSRIHSAPEAADAGRVRAYARSKADASDDYEALARAIDELFRPRATTAALAPLVAGIDGKLGAGLRAEIVHLQTDSPRERLAAAGRSLEAIRRGLPRARTPEVALRALRASIVLEREAFASGQAAVGEGDAATRRSLASLLDPLAASLYGTGLIGDRHLAALRETLGRFSGESVELGVWRSELGYLGRASEWSRRWLAYHFGPSMERLGAIEPLVALYEPDRLRGSPLLPYSRALDALARDAQSLAGVEDRVLGLRVGSGLRALNPGIGRGRLRMAAREDEVAALAPDAVAVLPETVSELPPVAAILTLGEGSSLSHVQLLARNLGIPNAVVSEAVAARLEAARGEPIEVAVSPGGVVQIDRIEAAQLAAPSADPPSDLAIRVDVERLDLARRDFVPLGKLGADDSGRICGPKAANLGELRKHFGEVVPDGFVIPFGVFRQLLDAPIDAKGGTSAFEWLRERYAGLRALDPAERPAATSEMLARMREWIAQRDPGDAFRAELDEGLARLGGGGVFVRSDTNVEDLPGFTGAGLNLTVPNVVGPDRVLEAVLRVWASPFSDRAHAWRQAHMERPEWVLPSVLIQRAYPAAKSGVMLTVNVETGDPGMLTVAVGEGVGGAVDGQAAESLRIERASGRVRFLAQASSPLRAELDPAGGIRRVAASGRETLLEPAEIAVLLELADRVRDFPALRGPGGTSLPADVEFAFRDGRLALLQIRPFVESRRALESERLRALDAPYRKRATMRVRLDEKLAAAGS